MNSEKHKKKDTTVEFCCKIKDEKVWADSEYLFWYLLARNITKSLV
jgi:hypothetical protein